MKIEVTPSIEEMLGITENDGPMAALGGAFDAADRYDRTLALWAPPFQSADSDVIPEKMILDSRARDSLRNDAYVAGGGNIHKDNIVGSAYFLNAKPNFELLGLTPEWAEEFQNEVESMFTLWAESPEHWVDAARRNTLTDIVRLALGVYVMSGEVLASVEWLEPGRRPFSTAIQMIDVDRLSSPAGVLEGPRLRGGVKRDRFGAPLGYFIREAHPSDYASFANYLHKYVPARKPWGRMQMIHIFEQTRPDQSRGVSELVTALKEIKITSKFRDIVLQNAVVNATYAASIESDLPTDAVFQSLGSGDFSDAISKYAASYMSEIGKYVGSSRNMHIDGVKIPHLFPGTKLNIHQAGQGGPLGTDFEQSLLRYISASLGVSYEQLSKDYTSTNYSSARAAMNETWKFLQSRKKLVADKLATYIYRLWLEEAIATGKLKTVTPDMPNFYEGLNAEAYSDCTWLGAGRGQIDELKETQASVLKLKYNLSTIEDEAGRLGKDWRKILLQASREKKILEELGLYNEEEDNMMNSVDGKSEGEEGEDVE